MKVLPFIGAAPRRHWLYTVLIVLFTHAGVSWAAPAVIFEWRHQVSQTRQLAENDAPAALREAQRLQARLAADAVPTDRVRLLNLDSRIENYLMLTKHAETHARQAQAIAKQYHDKIGLAEADLNLVLVAVSRGKLEELDTLIPHCMEMLEGSNRPDLLSEAMELAVMVYQRKGLLDDAVAVAMRSLELAQQSHDPAALANAYLSKSKLYQLSDHPAEVQKYVVQMFNQACLARNLRMQSTALIQWGRVLNSQGDFSNAEQRIRAGIELARRTGIPALLTVGLYALAENLHMQGRTAEAIDVLDEVVAIYEKHPHKTGLWWVLDARSEYSQELGRNSQADAEHAWQLAQEIDVPLYLVKSGQRLADIAASHHDWKQAYGYTAQVSRMLEKMDSEGLGTRMAELAKRFEEDSKRHKIEALTRENERQQMQHRRMLVLLGGVTAAMAGILLFLAQQRRSNHRLEEINRALQAGEHRYRTLVENLPDAVVRYDCNYRRILANSAYYRVTGLAEADVIGKTPVEASPDGDVSPTYFQKTMRSVMESGQPAKILLSGPDRTSEASQNTIYYDYRLVPEYGPDGSLIGLLGLGHDVSELKAMQALLQAREVEFRTLVEHSPDVIVRYDHALRRTYVNPTYIRLNGEIGDRVLGKTPAEMFLADGEMAADYQAELEQVLVSATHRDLQLKWPTAGGGWLYMDVRAVPEFDDQGQVNGILTVGRDITAQKELELQLQESQTMLRALAKRNESIREAERRHLAREVHDELGQMLNAVRLNLIVLQRRFGSNNPEMQGMVGTMLEHLGNTIAMARNIVLALHPTVLDAGIALALDWLAQEFGKSTGIACALTVEESIALDETQSMVIFRIVQECLTNVARHSGASAVEISLVREDGVCCLEISDDGRGFDVAQPRTRKSLGLIGMRERVFMLGGAFYMISAPGEGTLVRIEFPMMMEEKEEAL